MSETKDERPRILGATDLTHLNPSQRLSMLGRETFVARRDVLRGMLGAAAFVAVPAVLLPACDDGGGCPCQSDSSCACQSDSSCPCQSDSPTCNCEPGCPDNSGYCPCEADAGTPLLDVTMVEPMDGATEVSTDTVIRLAFSEPVCIFDVGWDIQPFDPAVTRQRHFPNEPEGSTRGTVLELVLDQGQLDTGTLYTVQIYGYSALTYRRFDQTFSFTTTGPGCSCDDHTCDCESYCSCQPDYCGCQFEGCPTYRV